MKVISPDEIPPRSTAPVGNALHHLRHAFALLNQEIERQHWSIVGAHALAKHAQRASKRVPKEQQLGSVIPLLDSLQREREDIEAAMKLCELTLIAAVSKTGSQCQARQGKKSRRGF